MGPEPTQPETKIAQRLAYFRGDGWWTLEHAFVFATREQAEQYGRSGYGINFRVEWREISAPNGKADR